MPNSTLFYFCSLVTLSLLASTAHAAAGDTCLCKRVSGARCLKATRPLDESNVKDGADAGPCAKVDCETWQCTDDGATAHCIEKLMKIKLVKREFTDTCIVKIPEGQTFLTPYATSDNQDNKAFRPKPSQFAIKFGANALCWIFHGTTHLLDTEDPQQLTTVSALPVENCKPLKIKCVDRLVRNEANKSEFPGPAIMLEFVAPDGAVDGVGVSPRANAALSSTNVKPIYLGDGYTPERLANFEGFKPLFADNSQTGEIFEKFPAWKNAFFKDGKLTTLPLIVNPTEGFVTDQMAWFIITPPYCTYPYIQN